MNTVRVALLINERQSREKLAKCIESPEVVVEQYPTASHALVKFATTRYDLIVIHWKVHPGLKCGNPILLNLALMLQETKENTDLLYWEVGLTVIDAIRAKGSPNVTTPVVGLFPNFCETDSMEAEVTLTRESVESDLRERQPTTAIFEVRTEKIAEKLAPLIKQRT